MASEIRNDCVGCTALGLPCRHCYMGRDYRVLICDKCGTEVDMLYIIDNDSEELCGECAKERLLNICQIIIWTLTICVNTMISLVKK